MNNFSKAITLSFLVFSFFLCPNFLNAKENDKLNLDNKDGKKIENLKSANNIFKLIKATPKKDSISPPDFTWIQDGKTFSFLEATKDKFVMLHFWTAWSEPCQQQAKELEEISKELEKKGVLFISVALPKAWDQNAIKEGIKEVKKFAKKENLTFPIIFGNAEIVQAIGGLMGVPFAFCYDNKGKFYSSVFGKQAKEEYLKAVEAMLNARK